MAVNPRIKVRDMAYIALSAAFISVCAWISVPAVVPFTLQTFAIFLCAAVFGAKRAFVAVALYILLGAIGLPVFSGFRGGFGMLFGATGGYITGFLPAAVIAGWKSGKRKGMFGDVAAMVLALIVCYTFGTVWYACVYASGLSGITAALMACVVPYIVPDALKIILAAMVAGRLRRVVDKQ